MSRSKAKPASDSSPPTAPEMQLIKAPTNGSSANGSAPIEPTHAAPVATVAIRRDPPAEALSATPNGGAPAPTNGAAAGGEPRRKLHLSLGGNGNGPAPANGGGGNGHVAPGANGNGHGPEAAQRPNFAAPPAQPQNLPQGLDDRAPVRPFQAPPPRNLPPFEVGRGERELYGSLENRPLAQQPRDIETARKNGNFIDQELRSRVDGDIAAFLAAFDAALAADTPESRFGLREATDRLLRAGARTRIELERLEARMPLPLREGAAAPDAAAWRQR